VALTAQRVADRLFNSGLPLPKRMFTGVGSHMFAAKGYGTYDMSQLMLKNGSYGFGQVDDYLDYAEKHARTVVIRANRQNGWSSDTPEFMDLTGNQILLHALSNYAGGMYNLLGDNLMAPYGGESVFRLYKTTEDDRSSHQRIFNIFREEMERSVEGWVEIIPFPHSENILFLKGSDGAFDWVIKDQRDKDYSGNPLYPMLESEDLPTAMKADSRLSAHLYFKRGVWLERLEHDAEDSHYENGGSASDWPGYKKMIEREVQDKYGFSASRQPSGEVEPGFIPHRLNDFCLMVSPLVTIDSFWEFFDESEWKLQREERSTRSGFKIDNDLSSVSPRDQGPFPAGVTWLDAVAYCRAYEKRTGLPVRLLTIDNWRDIRPSEEALGASRAVRALTGRHPDSLRFIANPAWANNSNGLPFLCAPDFGEWLLDWQSNHAPAVCVATGESVIAGPLERVLCPTGLTMSYKGLKVGFRLCYIARLDA